LTKKCTRSSAG